ncbi:oxidoreductase [Streptomyces sp. NPDC006923]|uniref:oxidoreductase n=1 Tax=Streptomyces sp. NPDC006923 TaxID=3155355 RepID=UPI0033E8BEF2
MPTRTDKQWTAQHVPDQSGRTAVITGANTGIGFETALVLARRGARVVLAVRDAAKGAQAKERIVQAVPGARITVQSLDLSSLASIRAAAEALRAADFRIDLLINNAGIMFAKQLQRTADGFEAQLGTNHLGHFALTGLLLDRMIDVPGSRVVTVSSMGHRQGGPMDLSDINWTTRAYSPTAAYGHSKRANLMFTYELQRRLAQGARTIAVAAHPGGADTGGSRRGTAERGPIGRALFAGLVRPLLIQGADRGAWPILRAATDPGVEGGQYYGPSGFLESTGHPKVVRSNAQSYDKAAQDRLWKISEELTKVGFPV